MRLRCEGRKERVKAKRGLENELEEGTLYRFKLIQHVTAKKTLYVSLGGSAKRHKDLWCRLRAAVWAVVPSIPGCRLDAYDPTPPQAPKLEGI